MPDVADFSQCSAEEILRLQKENQARATNCRYRMRMLLDTRLARKITKEEFDQQRAEINEEVLACRQRGLALDDERLLRAYNALGRQRERAPVAG